KIYSYRQQFLEDINKAPAPWNEMLFDNLIFILGWISEEESLKKSERIISAVRKKDSEGNVIKAISYKGNKWGRKEIKNKEMITDILALHKQGLSLKVISQRVQYNDKNNNKVNPSVSLVWKIIKNKKENRKKL
ncbi:unnamed protein product, partial [marine sediment metagenome]